MMQAGDCVELGENRVEPDTGVPGSTGAMGDGACAHP